MISAPTRDRKSLFASSMALIWMIAFAKLLFHIYFNSRCGYFRDEFDYIACGDHLARGRADQQLLIPFLITPSVKGLTIEMLARTNGSRNC